MPQARKLLIAIADGAHVRFVRPAANQALHANGGIDSVSAHKRSAELGTDRPGESFHGYSTAHHAMTPCHDPHLLEKTMFAKVVAGQLNAAAHRLDFDDLILVAPPRTLKTIHDALDAATRARVVFTLEKDLVKTPDWDLPPYVQEWAGRVDFEIESPVD
jgi:protein required for attachment to host cells